MKRSVIMLLALCLFTHLWAVKYKILFINTKTIKIGNKICEKNSIFSDKEVIHWSHDGQAFKAINLKTKQIHLFCKNAFKDADCKTIKYYIKTKHISSRGKLKSTNLAKELSRYFYLLDDTLKFNTAEFNGLNTDSLHYYKVVEKKQNQPRTFFFKEKGILTFHRAMFEGLDSVDLCVEYIDESLSKSFRVTDKMRIFLLPMKIE